MAHEPGTAAAALEGRWGNQTSVGCARRQGTYVYVQTKDGQRVRSSNRAQLFEGEWVLSDPGK